MHFSDDKSKGLVEIDWNNQVTVSEIDISGWVSEKNALKSRSLEYKSTPIKRQQYKLSSPIRIRKYLSPVLQTPQIPIKTISPNREKIETLLLKILDKSQNKIKIKDRGSSYFKANRLGIKFPSNNYTVNLPRSLNMIKKSKQTKSLYKKKKIQPFGDRLSFVRSRLGG
ncbi:hypothetical protein SteCoe_26837 [Stentor coeruleus]|uniref:Uncharacterized protein n=1 Tax=Stentor coeruleus TaxID=5963 RepID=A0A1R2BBX0_9CILI|nr:hypothetical protein SteCoe_26837 [Stentor coeruleus]